MMEGQRERQPLFSKERVETGRIPELDFAKGLCIIGLILVHIYDYVLRFYSSAISVTMVSYLGYPIGAPLFMFCMGMTLGLSRHNTPKGNLFRGIALLTIGQLLNLLRYGLIYGLGSAVVGEYIYFPLLILLISVDIMQFAGMAFLTLGLLGLLKVKPVGIVVVAVALNIAGMFLECVETDCYAVNQLLGFLWGTNTESYFPLFNWFIFVAVGNLYGYYYTRLNNKKRWYAFVLPIGAILTALYYYLAISGQVSFIRIFDDNAGFQHMNIFDAVGCLICVVTFIGVLWLFTLKFEGRGLCYISKNINKYYCVSYILIFVLMALSTEGVLAVSTDFAAIVSAVVIFALTTLIIMFYKKRLEAKIAPWCRRHFVILSIAIWAMSIALFAFGYSCCDAGYPNFMNEYLGL